MNPPKSDKRFYGYLCATIAAATYGMNPLFAVPLYADGLTPADALLLRYTFAMLILFAMTRIFHQRLRIRASESFSLLALGIIMGASSLLLFESYNYMDVGIASTILFTYPLMVAVIMTLVFKERLRLLTIICLATATLGITFLYKGGSDATLSLPGTICVLTSALLYAIYLVWTNRPSMRKIPTLTLTFYVILSGTSVFVADILLRGTFHLPTTPLMWGCGMALAFLPTVVSFLCTTVAVQSIGSTPTAILGAIEPLTGILIGIFAFGESLTTRDSIGLMLILTAVTFVIAGNNISKVILRMRKFLPSAVRRIFPHHKHR